MEEEFLDMDQVLQRLKDVEAEHQRKMERQDAEHQREMERLKAEHQREMERLKAEHQRLDEREQKHKIRMIYGSSVAPLYNPMAASSVNEETVRMKEISIRYNDQGPTRHFLKRKYCQRWHSMQVPEYVENAPDDVKRTLEYVKTACQSIREYVNYVKMCDDFVSDEEFYSGIISRVLRRVVGDDSGIDVTHQFIAGGVEGSNDACKTADVVFTVDRSKEFQTEDGETRILTPQTPIAVVEVKGNDEPIKWQCFAYVLTLMRDFKSDVPVMFVATLSHSTFCVYGTTIGGERIIDGTSITTKKIVDHAFLSRVNVSDENFPLSVYLFVESVKEARDHMNQSYIKKLYQHPLRTIHQLNMPHFFECCEKDVYEFLAGYNDEELMKLENVEYLGRNVIHYNGWAVKSYDKYNDRPSSRNMNNAVEAMTVAWSELYTVSDVPEEEFVKILVHGVSEYRGKVFVYLNDKVGFIAYPMKRHSGEDLDCMECRHLPVTKKQFIAVVEQVQRLHDANWIHGDIRFVNMVFGSEESEGLLIDFDFAKKIGNGEKPTYEDDYGGLNDGKGNLYIAERHAEAIAGNEMFVKHDIYSLAHIARGYFGFGEDKQETGHTLRSTTLSLVDLLDYLNKETTVLKHDGDSVFR